MRSDVRRGAFGQLENRERTTVLGSELTHCFVASVFRSEEASKVKTLAFASPFGLLEGVKHFHTLSACEPMAIPDKMVTVEHFIVDIDRSEELMIVELQVSRVVEGFLAVGTGVIVQKPAVDALHVEDVVAAQHSAY